MRLFVAVDAPLPGPYAELAARLVEAVPSARTVRPVPADTWHATLRFLGDVQDPAPIAAALRQAVQGHAAMAVEVAGLGAFPAPAKARVVWAGMHAEGLAALAAAVAAATPLAREPEAGRPFHAHVTLARLDPPRDVRPFVDAHARTPVAEGRIVDVALYRSDLGPGGPRYTAIERFPLAGPPSSQAGPPSAQG